MRRTLSRAELSGPLWLGTRIDSTTRHSRLNRVIVRTHRGSHTRTPISRQRRVRTSSPRMMQGRAKIRGRSFRRRSLRRSRTAELRICGRPSLRRRHSITRPIRVPVSGTISSALAHATDNNTRMHRRRSSLPRRRTRAIITPGVRAVRRMLGIRR